MKIGIDFDNTLAGYDHIFPELAYSWGLIDSPLGGNKERVRAQLQQRGKTGEQEWMRLQGQVYGRYMGAASLNPGAGAFLHYCKQQGHTIYIVSHKTPYGHFDPDKIHLPTAATEWMEQQGFFHPEQFAISPRRVYFLPTREEKIAQIRALALDLFIDDLEAVLDHPDFPHQTQRIHYQPAATSSTPTSPHWHTTRHWREIIDQLSGQGGEETTLEREIAEIACRPLSRISRLSGGNNSNAYRVELDGAAPVVIKQYHRDSRDASQRLQRELKALTFLQQQGEEVAPRLLASAPDHHLLMIELIDGTKPDGINNREITLLCDFISRLKHYSRTPSARSLKPAQEACLSSGDLTTQIDHRLQRLSGVATLNSDLQQLLDRALLPAFSHWRRQIPEFTLDHHHATLSPADCGPHNTLVGTDGKVIFIDFDYFGWDDPVKLTADTLIHPGFFLTTDQQQLFRKRMANTFTPDDPGFATRLEQLFPLYVLRWCTILLNEFLPEQWARRIFSGSPDHPTIRQRQLAKATRLFQSHFTPNCEWKQTA